MTKDEAVDPKAELSHVSLWMCQYCLDGLGGECHSPGCVMFLRFAPTGSIRELTEPVDASAIIPTPELREAVKTVCLAAEGEIRMSEICGCPHDDVSESRIESDVATVRAAFKEPNNA